MGQAASMCRFRGCRYKKNKTTKNMTTTTTTTATANSATTAATAATAATTPTNTANSTPVSGEQKYHDPPGCCVQLSQKKKENR